MPRHQGQSLAEDLKIGIRQDARKNKRSRVLRIQSIWNIWIRSINLQEEQIQIALKWRDANLKNRSLQHGNQFKKRKRVR